MKKKKIMNVFFILLPVMAVALATTADSVTVFDAAAGKTAYYSYFSMVPDHPMQLLPPLAAILSLAAAGAAAFALAKKEELVAAVKWLSIAAAIAAVMPLLRRTGDVLMVPNAILPLLMMAEYVLAYAKEKMSAKEESGKKQKKAPRLR